MHLHNSETQCDVRRELVAKFIADGFVLLRAGGEAPVHAGDRAARGVRVAAENQVVLVGVRTPIHRLCVTVVTDAELHTTGVCRDLDIDICEEIVICKVFVT